MGQGMSQSNETAHVYAQQFDEEGHIVNTLSLDKAEAKTFDFEQYVLDNQTTGRLKVSSVFRSTLKVEKHIFDSAETDELDGSALCKTTKVTSSPMLGMVVCSRDNLSGVRVKEVIAGSPAAQIGVQINDVIFNFDDTPIDSYCDLKMAVAKTEIGSRAPIHFETEQISVTKDITIGARTIDTHHYTFCDKAELEDQVAAVEGNLATYPNPTRKSSFINFKSDDTASPVSLRVMDMNGALVHAEAHNYFSGELRLEYVFDPSAVPGMYLFIIEQGENKYYNKVLYVKS